MQRASDEHVPVFTGGEARGVGFYEKALGFRVLEGTWSYLDKQGREVDAKEEGWRRENGGVSKASVVWCPDGVGVDLEGYGGRIVGDGRGLVD